MNIGDGKEKKNPVKNFEDISLNNLRIKIKKNIPLKTSESGLLNIIYEYWYYLFNIIAALASILGYIQITYHFEDSGILLKLLKFLDPSIDKNYDDLKIVVMRWMFLILTLIILICIIVPINNMRKANNIMITNFIKGF